MKVSDEIEKRLDALIREADSLKKGNQHDQVRSGQHQQECVGWAAAALHVVQMTCPDDTSAYRKFAETLAGQASGPAVNRYVGKLAEVLKNLSSDIKAGLLHSVDDRARAETFDDFLDHGKAQHPQPQ